MPVGFEWIELKCAFPGQYFLLAELRRKRIGTFAPSLAAEVSDRNLDGHHINLHRPFLGIVPILDHASLNAQEANVDSRHRPLGGWFSLRRRRSVLVLSRRRHQTKKIQLPVCLQMHESEWKG